MKYKLIKNNSKKIFPIGLGCGIGNYNSNYSYKELLTIIRKSFDYGVNFFDTAPVYGDEASEKILGNAFSLREKENIFIKNIPDNLNYNSKRNFISIELYLHTSNLFNENKFPLSVKKDTRLFDEAVKISNIIGEAGILNNQSMFEIQKKST